MWKISQIGGLAEQDQDKWVQFLSAGLCLLSQQLLSYLADEGSSLKEFLIATADLSPDERAKRLDNNKVYYDWVT